MIATVGIIVPCYNEAQRLPVESFLAYQSQTPHVTFCFVDDGSQDGTADVLKQLQARNQSVNEILILPQNGGKAEAVRAGMLHLASRSQTPFTYLGYFDADLATPLSAIMDLQAQLDANPEQVMVMGSRIQYLGTDIQRSLFRHYTGRVMATLISKVLHLAVYDTQCGAKLFRRQIVPSVFAESFISPWLFDVEILARLIQQLGRRQMQQQVREVPLKQWVEQGDSRISYSYFLKLWGELYSIRNHYRRALTAV